jgi:ketosteroid isomerase-like protein
VDAHYHVDSIRIVLLKRSGDFAYAITRYYSTNGDQRDTGVNLVVLRKIADGWFIAAHEAAVPDTATAVKQLDMPSQH